MYDALDWSDVYKFEKSLIECENDNRAFPYFALLISVIVGYVIVSDVIVGDVIVPIRLLYGPKFIMLL